jgi:hypothetical protein
MLRADGTKVEIFFESLQLVKIRNEAAVKATGLIYPEQPDPGFNNFNNSISKSKA